MLIALITIGIVWVLTVVFDLPYIAFALSGAASALAIVTAAQSGALVWIIAAICIVAVTVVELFLT